MKLALAAVVSFGFLLSAAEPGKPHLIQFRLVLDKPSANSEQVELVREDRGGRNAVEVLNVGKTAVLDESDIQSAAFQKDPGSLRPQVGITFTSKGRTIFGDVTRTNLNQRLAILVDGKVVAAPVIRSEIPDGKAVIDGDFTANEATELAEKINKVSASADKEKGKAKPWNHGLYDRLD